MCINLEKNSILILLNNANKNKNEAKNCILMRKKFWRDPTECVTELDFRPEMIIFESILTTFEASHIFRGSWGSSENQLEPKT